jgi:pimeloyl-ACP methyl ester carboxylesterase
MERAMSTWLDGGAGRLYAYTGGRPFDPQRPVVAFIHGAQHDHSVWILQSRFLAHHGFSVLAFDLPGHGRSEGEAEASVEAVADRLAGALRRTQAKRVLLVGHSLGSLIALEVARRQPALAAGVALVCTAFPMRVSDALLAAARTDLPAAMDMINLWSFSASIAPFAARPSNPGPGFNVVWENLRLMQRIAERNGPEVLYRDFAACNAYRGGVDAAKALQCPVLFVLSEADRMTPPQSAQPLIEAAGEPQVVRIGHAGHALMAEAPDAVLGALSAFARHCFAAGAAQGAG